MANITLPENWVMDEDTDPLDLFLGSFAERAEGLKGDALRAYNDLEFFSRWCIAYGNEEFADNSPLLRTIYHELQYSDEDLLILAPRGSAKSTAVTVTWLVWQVGRNPISRFLIACASMEKQGLAFGRQIDSIITKNERFIEIFGELKPRVPVKWDAMEKIVSRQEPPSGLKDPTISVVGLGTSVPSRRADFLLIDDIVNQDNAYSEIKRAQVQMFVDQSCTPILVPTGRTVAVGTCWHPDDFYATTARQWGLRIPKATPLDTERLAALAPASNAWSEDDDDDGWEYEEEGYGDVETSVDDPKLIKEILERRESQWKVVNV